MFNLTTFVKEMLNTTDETDPTELSYLVFGKLAPDDREEALLQALRPFIREHVVNSRFVKRDAETREPVAVAPQRATRVDRPSPKVQRIKAAFNPKLAVSYRGATGYKLLGDFTVEDVRFVADRDRKNGENLIEWSDRLRKMEDALKEYGVSTLRDLPAAVTAEL